MGLSAIIVAAITLAAPSDAAVRADWAAHNQDADIRYLTLDNVSPQRREKWEQVLKYQVPAASRGINVDRQIPQRVGESNAYRIDLSHLQWGHAEYAKVLEKYPYAKLDKGNTPLSIRADWLVMQLADTRDSDAYYLFLYGDKAPKTDKEFLEAWGVDFKNQGGANYGWVENGSQVAVQGTRFVQHFIGRAGKSVWQTKDMNHVVKNADPLEFLDGNFKYDGSEMIAQVPKASARYGTRGAAQVYALANGDGKIVNEAPVRLVEDHKRTLNQTAIINNASCVGCHEQGMNDPTTNGLRQALEVGENLRTYSKDKQEEIESFHLSDSATTLQRNNQDFHTFVYACNQLTARENAQLYLAVLKDYRADLTIQRAANELYCSAEDLKLALGLASANGIVLTSRIAGLAHGLKVPRDTWEEAYPEVKAMLDVWRNGGKAKHE